MVGDAQDEDAPETGAGADIAPPVIPLSVQVGAVVQTATSGVPRHAFLEYLLRLADDRLILGHRLSEWAGHGPILEEDIALSNIALDLIGQANAFLDLAAEVEGAGRTADQLAFLRDAVDYRNVLLVELPRGDFGFTIARQFLFSAFQVPYLAKLQQSQHERLAGIAAKSYKECVYHLRHATDWMLKLGDGTAESHRRVQRALDDCWPYTHELFWQDGVDAAVMGEAGVPDASSLQLEWRNAVTRVLDAATLTQPTDGWKPLGGRVGRHTEHLGHLLAEMQILARSHPGASW